MAMSLTIRVILRSDTAVEFDRLVPGDAYEGEIDGITLSLAAGCPAAVTATPPSPADPLSPPRRGLPPRPRSRPPLGTIGLSGS